MNKISTEISTSGPNTSAMTPPEKRALSDVMQGTKRSGGNYGSLAKSQLQPKSYICHKVQPDDTMQRLALKYSIHVQEIKRINKLWSDAELSLLENVYIPVDASQLMTLRTSYPTLNVVQNISTTTNHHPRKSLTSAITTDEVASSIERSDSSTSTPTMTTTASSYEDYFSKIDRQIQTSKNTLKSFDADKQSLKSKTISKETSSSSLTSNNDNDNSDELSSSQTGRTIMWSNGRHKGIHHLSDNSVFVNIATNNPREKHVSAALERIRRERDDFDEL